ncbi:MAG: chorismate-binding protein [cyanobacterium endosymbiont of Epithemia adnata isolate EadnSB Bon19]
MPLYVHQLVNTVCSYLRQALRTIDCISVAFPSGSMIGVPKIRIMEIINKLDINKLEGEARGIYSGAISFLGLNGTADLNIVIRTILIAPIETIIGASDGI